MRADTWVTFGPSLDLRILDHTMIPFLPESSLDTRMEIYRLVNTCKS